MENKITLPRLAAMLAITTGKQKKLCEDFLKELFRIVSEELENGENVRIKGFGTFKLAAMEPRKSVNVATGEEHEIPGHKKVIFVAAKELATTVNSPFEAFEAVEVSDDIPTDVLLEVPEEEESGSDEETASESAVRESVDEEVVDEATSEAYGTDTDDAAQSVACSVSSVSVNEKDESGKSATTDFGGTVADSYEEENESEPRGKSRRFVWGFLAGFVAASVVALLYFYLGGERMEKKEAASPEDGVAMVVQTQEETVPMERSASDSLSDSLSLPLNEATGNEEVPTRPSDEPVYDTISTTRFLTTMAKEHYGNFNLWPIIYEENKEILGHPDRIKPGTKVVVPTLEKYGVDPHKPADIARIKQKGVEIYARYK